MYISNIDRDYMRSLDARSEIRQSVGEVPQSSCQSESGNIEVIKDIRSLTLQNNEFRRIIFNDSNLELTTMSIPVGEEIGVEVHENSDQFLFIELSYGKAITLDRDGNVISEQEIAPGDGIIIKRGTFHNIVNLGNYPMKLVSFYAPPVDNA